MVETVKRDPETSMAYLRLQEKLNRSRKEGRKEGEAAGDLRRRITLVCKKMRKNKTLEEIAEDLEEGTETIEPIYEAAKEFAPGYDPESVFEKIMRRE